MQKETNKPKTTTTKRARKSKKTNTSDKFSDVT